jgi:hypothetical protein
MVHVATLQRCMLHVVHAAPLQRFGSRGGARAGTAVGSLFHGAEGELDASVCARL